MAEDSNKVDMFHVYVINGLGLLNISIFVFICPNQLLPQSHVTMMAHKWLVNVTSYIWLIFDESKKIALSEIWLTRIPVIDVWLFPKGLSYACHM